ncbi:Uncharacterized protein TCAP_03450 [Tolypocladium capitatum]|uniref:Protein kinase domain-containing protein n=1 Tax=Tolypocladium capitatum TaxID=45235 RepID=A0A2K3QGD9_9HYPO|nr:Uncharacterized protein TCAP_03450 [Tolypocladium capitatum]
MSKRFKVAPILAVVTKEKGLGQDDSVLGFLMPFEGDSLEILADQSPDSTVPVTEEQLWDLARGVPELSRCGVMHGDINEWNTVLCRASASDSGSERSRLLLIDLGDEAPGYEGDEKALGSLFLWCLEHAPSLRGGPEGAQRIRTAAAMLRDGDFDEALGALSPR